MHDDIEDVTFKCTAVLNSCGQLCICTYNLQTVVTGVTGFTAEMI